MKKQTIILGLLLCSLSLFAKPTFVDTTVQNKNVVLEEFTGINCGFCPDGHRIANEIAKNNPGRVVLINIHQGGYAATTPDLRTAFGDALANQAGISGYPSGTVNRHVFSGGKTVLNRDKFTASSNTILGQVSPVNIAAKATIDMVNRILTVQVEVYYTADEEKPSNSLNVAILQSKILGPQSGMNANPDQIVGNLYSHNHSLRDLITGQWGLDIPTTSKGSFHSFTIIDTLPLKVKNTELILEDIEIVAFVSQGHQEILSGCSADLTQTNVPDNYALILSAETYHHFECSNYVGAQVVIKNKGTQPITSVKFKYNAGENDAWQEFTDLNIPLKGEATLVLDPAAGITPKVSTPMNITVVAVNGESMETPAFTFNTIKPIVYTMSKAVTLNLTQDRYGSETSWAILDEFGDTITQGGPYENLSKGTELHEIPILFPSNLCYSFEIYDKRGDGINAGYGEGGYQIKDNTTNTVLINSNGKFGKKDTWFFGIGKTAVNADPIIGAELNLYPNPSSSNTKLTIKLDQSETINILIYDALGRLAWEQGVKTIEAGTSEINLPTNSMSKGFYSVIVRGKQSQTSQKLIIN